MPYREWCRVERDEQEGAADRPHATRISLDLATRKSSAPRRLFHVDIDRHSAVSRDDEVISAGDQTLA